MGAGASSAAEPAFTQAEDVEEELPATTSTRVSVPAGLTIGDEFVLEHGGHRYSAVVPRDHTPGGDVDVRIPAERPGQHFRWNSGAPAPAPEERHTMLVRVPAGAAAGDEVELQHRDGRKFAARVPEASAPGSVFYATGGVS